MSCGWMGGGTVPSPIECGGGGGRAARSPSAMFCLPFSNLTAGGGETETSQGGGVGSRQPAEPSRPRTLRSPASGTHCACCCWTGLGWARARTHALAREGAHPHPGQALGSLRGTKKKKAPTRAPRAPRHSPVLYAPIPGRTHKLCGRGGGWWLASVEPGRAWCSVFAGNASARVHRPLGRHACCSEESDTPPNHAPRPCRHRPMIAWWRRVGVNLARATHHSAAPHGRVCWTGMYAHCISGHDLPTGLIGPLPIAPRTRNPSFAFP